MPTVTDHTREVARASFDTGISSSVPAVVLSLLILLGAASGWAF